MPATALDPVANDTALTRRERRKLEVRGRILDASRDLFATHGIDATTIVEICDRADVAEKTFFNHFSSKKQLLQSFAVDGLQQLLEWIEEAREGDAPLGEKLESFFTRLVDEVDARGPMHRELLAVIVAVAHEAGDETRQARMLHDAFMGLVRDGVASGDVDPRHDPETLTEMLQGTYYTLTFNWAYLPDYPVRERAVASARFLASAFAEPGERA